MRILLAVCALLITSFLHAQQRLLDQPVKIKAMNVDVKADCFTATTFIEIEFYNPGNVEIEGLYRFHLQPGQVITGLQLDLNGRYRDGTIEERWKAANAYNTIVGKRIDPALLQYEYENRYRLNVYPIPARSSRKITITIQEMLKEKNGSLVYQLPLSGADSIANFQLRMSASNCSSRPVVMAGFLANDAFSFDGHRYALTRSARSIRLPFSIGFSIPAVEQAITVKQQDGKKYFALRLYPQASKQADMKGEKLLVYWDVSMSGATRDIKKEIQFLRELITRRGPAELTIIPFSVYPKVGRKFTLPSSGDWEKYLRSMKYEGGTSFSQLHLGGSSSDLVIVFSDGRRTYGGPPAAGRLAPVYAISSIANPDSLFLRALTVGGGGRYIDLHRTPVAEAALAANVVSTDIFNVRKNESSTRFFVSRSGPHAPILVYGTFDKPDELQISYGNIKALSSDRFLLHESKDSGSGIDRIPMLVSYPKIMNTPHAEAMLDFGLEEKVVTPRTSFIVLERVEDYIRYNIAPPKELEEECAARGFMKQTSKELREKEKQRMAYSRLTATMGEYNKMLVEYGVTQIPLSISSEDYREYIQNRALASDLPNKPTGSTTIESRGNNLEEVVVVTALGVRRQPKELGYAVTKVSGREITQADVVNVQSALTGKVSGLNVSTVNNSVFEDTRITLRGLRSLTGNNQPLLVLDGSIVPLHYLNNLNPKDIQDVTILKDASAAAIYGPDGVNGVILVTYKKGSRAHNYGGSYRLRDMPEELYIQQLAAAPSDMKLAEYERQKELHGNKPLFYIEAAKHLYAAGMKARAKDILFNAAEISNDPRVLRSVAFVLEEWKEFSDAISIYESLPNKSDEVIRDLAWAYYQAGRKQQAVDLIFTYITDGSGDQWSNAALLDDMNAMIAVNKEISTDKIPRSFLVAKPVDLRLVVSSGINSVHYMVVEEPRRKGGSQSAANTKSYYQYYSIIHQVKNAVKGRYSVSLRHYDWEGNTQPLLVKLIVLKNFGRSNQDITVETFVMNNQSGLVEIAEVAW